MNTCRIVIQFDLGNRFPAYCAAMLAYAPRREVAGLTGESWLAWLDRDLPVPYFHTEGGKSLLQLPYRNPDDDCSDIDINALLAAVRMRLSTPIGRAG